MRKLRSTTFVLASLVSLGLAAELLGNGGPFVVKYPAGDPAAKGVLARLESDLRPGRITDLRVLKEDLGISFVHEGVFGGSLEQFPPLVRVSAAYTIENPTDKPVTVDFGFPILRGIYVSPFSMMPRPEVYVQIDGKAVQSQIISNSAIYGIIRRQARQVIDKAIEADPRLSALVAPCRPMTPQAKGQVAPVAADISPAEARTAVVQYAVQTLKWKDRDAALLGEYASLDLGLKADGSIRVPDSPGRFMGWGLGDAELRELQYQNLGPLAAIGEQKATQFLAQVASGFDPKAGSTYESIFSAWGGDVREQAVDLKTGQLRPREITVDKASLDKPPGLTAGSDPTVYVRVDYLDPHAKITEAQRTSLQTILKNLPVVFTFAPMNLLYYQASFPAKSTQVLTVSYAQYAFVDTAQPASYQIAYVVHPASLWQEFGPINLKITAPPGVVVKASVALGAPQDQAPASGEAKPTVIHRATLADKTGELLVGVDREAWDKATAPPAKAPPPKAGK